MTPRKWRTSHVLVEPNWTTCVTEPNRWIRMIRIIWTFAMWGACWWHSDNCGQISKRGPPVRTSCLLFQLYNRIIDIRSIPYRLQYVRLISLLNQRSGHSTFDGIAHVMILILQRILSLDVELIFLHQIATLITIISTTCSQYIHIEHPMFASFEQSRQLKMSKTRS